MDMTTLAAKIDSMEATAKQLRRAVGDAQLNVDANRFVPVTTAQAADLARFATELLNAMLDLDTHREKLTAYAELEQALKEGRWSDVAHWGEQVDAYEAGATPAQAEPSDWEPCADCGEDAHTERCCKSGFVGVEPAPRKLTKCPSVPHRSLKGETSCVVSGGMIDANGQCEVHAGS